jgi:hypothetical protein
MDWLLRRFRRTGRARASLTCYLRENGPIAYALTLFEPDPRPRVEAMLESGLAWYWQSASRAAGAAASGDWTQLTRWSMAALQADLAAPDTGESAVTIIGIDGADAPTDLSNDRVAPWVRQFASDTPGPLHVVIRDRPDLVFVAQQPPEPVRDLLYAWGIDRAKAERRAYARLDTRNLEHWLRSLTG